jgi:hypothetical protein
MKDVQNYYQRRQAKLQWLQDTSKKEKGGGRVNLNSIRYENSRHFRNKEGVSEDFSCLHSTHIDSGAQPASYPKGTRGKATGA